MSDFVHRLRSAPAGIERVGEVKNEGIFGSDVPVGMHHARRDQHEYGIRLADLQRHEGRVVSWPILPKIKLVCPGDEGESVGLASVLVRTSSDSRMGHAEIRHGRAKVGREFVVPEEFGQPPAGVGAFREGLDEHTRDGLRGLVHRPQVTRAAVGV